MIRVCKGCKKNFILPQCLKDKRVTCSLKCRSIYVKSKNTKKRICPVCKTEFFTFRYDENGKIHQGKIFCSNKCRSRAKSNEASIVKKCLNCNKNFMRPEWMAKRQKFCERKCAWDYWFRNHIGITHPNYKEKITYSAIHSWILKIYGRPDICSVNDKSCNGDFEWANIYQKKGHEKFSRNEIEDFIPLCRSHHTKFDRYKNI